MTSSKNLNEILSDTKIFEDKYGIGYSEDVSTSILGSIKFVKDSDQDPKMKSATTDPRGK